MSRPKRTNDQIAFDAMVGHTKKWYESDGETLRSIVISVEPLAMKLEPNDHRHRILKQLRAAGKIIP